MSRPWPERLGAIPPDRRDGAARLAVKVVSAGGVARDRAERCHRYEEDGVGGYGIVDPRPERARTDFRPLGAEVCHAAAAVLAGNPPFGGHPGVLVPDGWLTRKRSQTGPPSRRSRAARPRR